MLAIISGLLLGCWTSPASAGKIISIPSPDRCVPQFHVPFDVESQTCAAKVNFETTAGSMWPESGVPPPSLTYQRQCPSCEPLYLLCMIDDTGGWNTGSKHRLVYNYIFEKVNAQQLLPGIELMCDYHDSGCSSDQAMRKAVHVLSSRELRYVAADAACGGAAAAIWQAIQFTGANIPMIAQGALNPEFIEYDGLFRVDISDAVNIELWSKFILKAGWRNVAVVSGYAPKWNGARYMWKNKLTELQEAGAIDSFADVPVFGDGKGMPPHLAEEAMREIYQQHRMKRIILLGYGSDQAVLICA